MVKTILEFKDELKSLRQDMSKSGESADAKLVASWVDRLVISLEELTPSLGLMREELNQLSEADECKCMPSKKPAKKKASKKVAKKKVAKKKAMKKKPMKKSKKGRR